LDAGVTSETVDGRMSMDCIATTDDSTFLVGIRPNFVDKPLAHAGNLERNAIIPNQVPDSFDVFFLGWQPSFMGRFPARFLEEDHNPLGPRFDHSHDDDPTPLWSFGLHDPVEISDAVGDVR
jgi:hypothetical protein